MRIFDEMRDINHLKRNMHVTADNSPLHQSACGHAQAEWTA